MTILITGLSHKTAPVEQREKASLSDRDSRELLAGLIDDARVEEVIALSTCNRTELIAVVPEPVGGEEALVEALLGRTEITRPELDCARYALHDERAVAHLFRVAASLDSMVIGESEIQSQVRSAWERAAQLRAAGPVLNRLLGATLEVGKRVRSETAIGAGSVSVSSVAVDLAQEALGDLGATRVLVIGAGSVAESTARALADHGVAEVVVANRTVGTARTLAQRVAGRGVGFGELVEELRAADIVISSTDAPHPILERGDVERAMRGREDRPMMLIDIAVPRDLDPNIAGVPGATLHDIDDLEQVVEMNLNGRFAEAERGEVIVLSAVAEFSAWRDGRAAAPAIRSLRERAEQIRVAELARLAGRWDSLSDADRERLEALTKAIVNKLLHEPTVRVQEAARNGAGPAQLESLRQLFGLAAEER